MQALLWEIALIGALVLVASLILHYLAYKKGILDEHAEQSEKNDDAGSSEISSEPESNPLLKKWLAFGGGYYGTIALVKLLLIEFAQVRELITNWPGLDSFVTGSGLGALINLAVAIFVEQFHNFAQAISWPAYYVSHYPIWQCALFVVSTYLIFSGAQKLAWNYYTTRQQRLI